MVMTRTTMAPGEFEAEVRVRAFARGLPPDRIRAARRAKGLTQAKLAAACHVSRSRIAMVERGARSVSPSFLPCLAAVLGLSPDSAR